MKIHSSAASLANAFLLVSLMISGTSCTKKAETGTVRLVMPTSAVAAKATSKVSASKAGSATGTVTSQSSNSWNSALNPSLGSDINCYAVFIGGGDLAGNSCTVGLSAADATTIAFGPNVGFVPSGGEIVIETPAGSRIIYVVGLHSGTAAACTSYLNTQPDSTNLSDPFLIATQAAEIPSGASSLTVAPTLDTSKKIIDCKFIQSGGGSSPTPFGDKRDGIITAVPAGTPVPMQAGSSTLSSATTRSGTAVLANTKVFAASRRVSDISGAGISPGALLTTAALFTSDEFDVGDEIVWYVAGGASTLGSADDPVLGACGGGMFLGRFGTARIQSVDRTNQKILLDRPITGAPATIRSANLSAAPSTLDYCTILISRVSSFESIVVPDGGNSLTMKVAPFSYVEGVGGILMVRASSIYVGSGSSLTIDGNAAGFAGGAAIGGLKQGDGVNGSGTSSAAMNYNGGSPGSISTLGGSGGGHAGAGGKGGGNAPAVSGGGSPLNHCIGGLPCAPLLDQKVFFGGGGGGSGSAAVGGNGGGIIILYADAISGAGTLSITAAGGNGGSGGAGSGAGAGGAIGFMYRSTTVSGIVLSTSGGSGGSGTFGGGGGGGGVTNFVRCPLKTASPLVSTVAGGTGGASAVSGSLGLEKVVDDPAVCTLP